MHMLQHLEVRAHPTIADLWVIEDGTLYTSNRILSPKAMENGYLRVNIKRCGTQKTLLVHRAVAEAFIVNPHNKPTVNHLDGDKANNCVGNLEWATHSENAQHAWDTGLVKAYKRQGNHREQFAAMVRVQPRDRNGRCIASPKQP